MRKMLGVAGFGTAWRGLAALLLAGAATAQEPAPAAPADDETATVVVTATRRSQSLDQVPIAVSEVSGETLEQSVLRDTQALQMQVPSLVVTVSGSENAGSVIRIRGIGTSGGNVGFESSVGVFVDDVYLSRSSLALTDLIDIDRIEVLRGPQGTLFGKNTSVGAIRLVSNAPGFTPDAALSVSYGNDNARLAQGMINLPLVDHTLAVRFAAQINERDGFIHNQYDGKDYNDRDRYTLRGQLLYQPLEGLSLRLIADRIVKDERCCAAPYTQYGPTAPAITALGGTVFEPPSEDTAAFNRPVASKAEDSGVSLHLDWDFDWAQLRGLVSYRDSTGRDQSDGDYSDIDLVYIPVQNGGIRTKTAELSLHGVAGRLDWLIGVYGADEDLNLNMATLLGDDAGAYVHAISGGAVPAVLYPSGRGQTDVRAAQSGSSWSLFTHDIVDLGAGFDLTLGLRWLHEQKAGGGHATSDSPSCNPAVTLPASARFLCGADPYRAHYDDDRFTGTASLGWKFAGDLYTYASYSSGFKSGGINLNPPTTANDGDRTFRPETVDAYELGLKAPFFGRRLQTRTALFWMDIDDFQLAGYDGLAWQVQNATVRSRGVEFESTLYPAKGLDLRAAVTYADAEFTKGANDGAQMTNAPRWTGQLGAGYAHALPFWSASAFANVVARYQSEVNTGVDLDPNKRQGGYTLLNARAGLQLPAAFEVSLWGANLTDKHYNLIIFDSPAQSGSYNGYVGQPRACGIEVRKRFF
ncbi:TonB-dependent receptor [Solimonas soli]|uniref:TonB-dependent receptor n=1 Tax=Solimonas soli TaxID=413479 RepID=UPI0004BBDADD|nr:TonB-dependent receptor [Solimonas soli]